MRLATAIILLSVSTVTGIHIARAQDARPTATFAVDYTMPARSTRDMLERVAPVIAIYAVEPAASDCRGEDCGPVARFFVFNRSLGGARKIAVDCSAVDHAQALIATIATTPEVPAAQPIAAQVVFRGADFSRFAQVTCSIAN